MRIHCVVHRRRSVIHRLLKVLQLRHLDFAIDIGLHVRHIALHPPHEMSGGACNLGQALRTDHYERHHPDHHEFREADIEH